MPSWSAYAAVGVDGVMRFDSICSDASGVKAWQRAAYTKAEDAERLAMRIMPVIIMEAAVKFKAVAP